VDKIRERALDEVRSKIEKEKGGKVALMFSGGHDSSAALLVMAESFPQTEIDLLVMNNGFFYPEELRGKAREKMEYLKQTAGINALLNLVCFDFRDLMVDLGIRSLHEDSKNYPTPLVACACKMLMHFIGGSYCEQNEIHYLADGYTEAQKYFPEQMVEFREPVAEAVRVRYGVTLVSPIYESVTTREEIAALLSSYGLEPERFDREKGGQAKCSMAGSFRAPFGDDPEYQQVFTEGVEKYTKQKLRIILSGEEIEQRREKGIVKLPSYMDRIRGVAAQAERL